MQALEPLTIPLEGQQLIEASAGTGKTFTIGLLYLRMLLERELTVDEILVVTFTNNATEELRTRIRQRIKEAGDMLGGLLASEEDPLLAELLAKVKDREHGQTLLRDALTRMDEASVHTIHGFCQRMLREHAFESSSPFETEFLESEQGLRRQIMEDYWRQRFYPASEQEAAWAAWLWNDPYGLARVIDPLLAQAEAELIPTVAPEKPQELEQKCAELFTKICAEWTSEAENLTELLVNDKALSRNKKDGYHPDRLKTGLQNMAKCATHDAFPWKLLPCMELLASSVMATKLKKKKTAPKHHFFQIFDDFYITLNDFTRLNMFHVQHEAYEYLRHELTKRKDSEGKIYFDDLLIRLDEALKGSGGKGLVAAIRKTFPVALVDEFQDTDPLQYRIFHTIYREGSGCGFFMIGDPKQAIYSFRGADIFTYIKARRDTPELGRYTMATNYRASTPMVQAVNSFFDKSHPFVFDQDIEFSPVSSSGNPDRNPLLVQGNAPSPFKVLLLNDETLASSPARGISKEMAGQASATWCAAEISRLLMAGQAGEALIGDEQLSSGHIAVLTRTHYEAETMRQALSKLGVASVYYSMESVYTTPEAAEMYQLLHALTQPGDSTAVRTGLVTVFFGYNGHDFDRFRSDQQEWEQLLNDVWEYHRIWNKHGFLAMFEQLIAEQRVVSRIMARADGERQLTNILHLAELLQEQNFQRPGMEELRRWLSEQIAAAESEQAGSAQQLRLESDENLIRIITIHKAKGLEYPVVFLPFIWSGRQPSPSDLNIFHDPDDLRCIIDMGSGVEENAALAAKERLAEDLRILYVALTRASYSCYICWGRVSGINHSAAAYLLHRDNEGNPINFPELNREVIRSDFALLNQDETLFEVLEQPAVHETGELKQVAVDDELRAREFTGSLNVEWRITSYSGLAGGQDHNDAMDEPKQAAPSVEDMGPSEHTFPRGPGAGLALHAIFENIDFSSATPEDLQKVVEEQLSIAGIGEQWRETAIQWITRVLDTDLDNSGQLRLRGLETRDRLNEMHFYFSLSSFDSNTFNRVLQQYDIPPLSGPDKRINGLMTGFIDLFFRHNNQYFIADYKSNHLGVSMDNYDRPSMERAMLEHRYDLQYLIYTLAIHRYLRTRIPDYDYDRDFGGVYYFFLRGMSPDSGADKGVYQVKPDLQLIEELDRCCGAEEAVTC